MSNRELMPGQVFGSAGMGLSEGSNQWAANDDVARVGKKGEQQTEAVLNRLACQPGGFTVLHDLTIPGKSSNIDSVVVHHGNRIELIDTKSWKPGFYWTMFGTTRNKGSKYEWAHFANMEMAYDIMTKWLAARGLASPISMRLVVWPSRDGQPISVSMLKHPFDSAMTGDRLERFALKHWMGNRTPAEPRLVSELAGLTQMAKSTAHGRSRDGVGASSRGPAQSGRAQQRGGMYRPDHRSEAARGGTDTWR